MPDEPFPAAADVWGADVWGEVGQAEPVIDLDGTATGLNIILNGDMVEADPVFGDVTVRRRQGVTFEDDAPIRATVAPLTAPTPNTTRLTEPWWRGVPLAPTIRQDYALDGGLIFDEWQQIDPSQTGFGCLWPYAPCGTTSAWARMQWLDEPNPGNRNRIPYSTLCEMHWMNRGQLYLDIPEPEPVNLPEPEARCMATGCARVAYWWYTDEGVYCNYHRTARMEANGVGLDNFGIRLQLAPRRWLQIPQMMQIPEILELGDPR